MPFKVYGFEDLENSLNDLIAEAVEKAERLEETNEEEGEPMLADSKNLLKFMYAMYLARRKEGKGISDSNYFGSTHELKKAYFRDVSHDDIVFLVRPLVREGYLIGLAVDNCFAYLSISDYGLEYCEENFAKNYKQIARELVGWVMVSKDILGG